MSIVVIREKADEQSTIRFTIDLIDEAGEPATPNGDLTYTLTDLERHVINDLEDVPLDSDSTVEVVLTGDDLQIGEYGIHRALLVECTYNSDAGTNLSFKKTIRFDIENQPGIV